MNNETFEEVGSYRLSLLNVYIIASTIIVLVALLVWALIVWTPLKRYIPGYGDIQQYEEALKINKEIAELQAEADAKDLYIDNIRRILTEDVDTEEADAAAEAEGEDGTEIPDSLLNVSRIKEDDLLRKEIELNEQIQAREVLTKTANIAPVEMPLEQMYFVPPISGGMISAEYMPDKKHYGIDVMAPKNTPVKAVMDGYVFSSDWTLETGNTIGIQHANNLISFYKHNSVLLKKTGDLVKAGEAVAIIGNTGTLSSGPHLHFELWHNGKAVNPKNYVIFN